MKSRIRYTQEEKAVMKQKALALLEQGKSQKSVAKALRTTVSTLHAVLDAYSGLSRPPIPEEREHLIRRNASGVSGLARALNPGASGLSEGSGLSMFFLDVSMPGK